MMKNLNLFSIFGLVVAATAFLGFSPGQPNNYANAPGDNGHCGSCHVNGTLDPDGGVALLNVPSYYLPGASYMLTLTIVDNDAVVGGFQVVATNGVNNAQRGTFTAGAGSQIVPGSGRIIHNAPLAFVGGQASWEFSWTAPPSGPPIEVKFYASGNAANGMNGSNNDYGYISTEIAALPIELAHFSAKKAENNNVQLFWKTFSETNNDQFVIERSINDRDFEAVGTIKGNGTTTEPREYAFRDRPVFGEKATAKYRLKQVDFDGKSTLSKIVSVEIGGPNTFAILPNIVQPGEAVRLQTGDFENEATFEVFDFSGKLVRRQFFAPGPDSFSLPTDDLKSGQYLVQAAQGQSVSTATFLVF